MIAITGKVLGALYQLAVDQNLPYLILRPEYFRHGFVDVTGADVLATAIINRHWLHRMIDAFLVYAFKDMKENWNIHFHVSSKNLRINFLQYQRASEIYFPVFYVMHTAFMWDYFNSSLPVAPFTNMV